MRELIKALKLNNFLSDNTVVLNLPNNVTL